MNYFVGSDRIIRTVCRRKIIVNKANIKYKHVINAAIHPMSMIDRTVNILFNHMYRLNDSNGAIVPSSWLENRRVFDLKNLNA